MKKRTAKIIKDSKRRGEWAESVFAVRAAENGLPVSKPFGESGSFDCVVGRPGKFVGVQVKCTLAEMQHGKGYVCSVKSNNKTGGSFRFSGGVCHTRGCVVHRSRETDSRARVDLFVQPRGKV